MTKRTLGMIPGLQPPKGDVETPQGFARLPTQAELHTSVKAWFATRPDYLSVEEEAVFNKNETKVLDTNKDVAWHAAIYAHKETGLKIGVSNDQHILHRSCIELPKPSTMHVLKHVWVEAWYTGELCEFYVGHADDVRRLMSILHETECSDVRVVASEEFIRTSFLQL